MLLSKRSVSPESDIVRHSSLSDEEAKKQNVSNLFRATATITDKPENYGRRVQSVQIENIDQDLINGREPERTKWTSRFKTHFSLNNKSFLKTVSFPSEKIANLYKRYFFRLNQNFINWFLIILIITSIIEVALHFNYNTKGMYRYARGIYLSIQISVYAALLSIINWTGSSGKLLIIVSYILVFLNCMTIVVNLLLLPENQHAITESISFTMFSIYTTYVMLPLEIRVSIFCGLLLTVSHLVTSVATKTDTINIGRLVSEFWYCI